LIDPKKIDEHRRRIVKTTGELLLVEFTSVVAAVPRSTHLWAARGHACCQRSPCQERLAAKIK
jgi:hypothetical protein